MRKLKNIFKFLKDYNEIRNPVITDINKQYWHTSILELPDVEEVYSVYEEEDYESLKILEVGKPEIDENSNREEAKRALKLYDELFTLYSKISKEAESLELILADGVISWESDGQKINHPILLQKVELEFNTEKPSFTVKCKELRTEVNTPLLRSIECIDQLVLSEYIQEIEVDNFHIADRYSNEKIFKKLTNAINKNGLTVTFSPLIYLRKKNLGFTQFIEKIIEDIDSKKDDEIHSFFKTLIGEHDESKDFTESENNVSIEQDAILTLPANDEQVKVIEYLNNYGQVLVQGPPGTGKTHTIANLIGHLLSQGQSVLVTSHTEKALSVLKDKVYKELQSLCISLLSTTSERKQMDDTLFEIAEKSTILDLASSTEKIEQLNDQRKKLIEEKQNKTEQLIEIRSSEYKDILLGNEILKPLDAAKIVHEGLGKLDYIPGKTVDDTKLLNLSLNELTFLYNSNQLVSKEEETFLNKKSLDINAIWRPEKLNEINTEIIKYKINLEGWVYDLKFKEDVEKEKLEELLNTSLKMKNDLSKTQKLRKIITNKVLKDDVYAELWRKTINDFKRFMTGYETYRTILFENNYTIDDQCYSPDVIETLNEIIEKGKEIPISFITKISKPKWRKVQEMVVKDKEPLEDKDDYENIKFVVLYELNRKNLLDSVNKLLEPTKFEIDTDLGEIETILSEILSQVELSVNWYEDVWIPFVDKFKDYVKEGNDYEKDKLSNSEDPMLEAESLVKERYIYDTRKQHHLRLLEERLSELEEQKLLLSKYRKSDDSLQGILKAFEKRDIKSYEQEYNDMVEPFIKLYEKRDICMKREKLLDKLKSTAPDWAMAIKNRIGIHGESNVPESIGFAWRWKQLNSQIETINNYDFNLVQTDIDSINIKLEINAKELAYENSWFNRVKDNTAAQIQAIEGWRQTMQLIGRGVDKNTPILREKARRLMPLCQTAIPVWIMPLNRVADSFDPTENKFDVIIIDEASQADILALSVLYLGKKIIIVGDDEQVSPESIGIKTDEVNALREQYLKDIPNEHLFDVRTSIYDIAKSSGFKSLMLTEHFRCVPEIIEFSKQLSYDGKIRALRDASMVEVQPVVEYRVPDGERIRNGANIKEAQHIASLICACIENEAYKDKTIGVITMVGQDQAQIIDRLLQINLDAKEYEDRRIQCGNSAQFQGDERDIIFISVVDSPEKNGGYIRLVSEDGNSNMNKKRYNVAASRAKDQLWVVHSLDLEKDLNPQDIRQKLIRHAKSPYVERDDNFNSYVYPLENNIMNHLTKKGYKVYQKRKIGIYNIDMVIEDGRSRIALECDGERLYTKSEMSKDLRRQAVLERLGWKFIRVRGSRYYKNPEETMNWIYSTLADEGINPSNITDNSCKKDYNEELLTQIKARAKAIREGWGISGVKKETNRRDILKLEYDYIK